MYFHYDGGFTFASPVHRDYREGTFTPVSQTYKTSKASLTSNASHPMLMSHTASMYVLDKRSEASI
eukprot:11325236-Ditylum_brightwellii.AAC.1